MKVKVSKIEKIKDSRKFIFEKSQKISDWENGDTFLADHGYIDENGNVKLIGKVYFPKGKYIWAELNGIGKLNDDILEIDATDDGVSTKEDIIRFLGISVQMAKEGKERDIEFWDSVLPEHVKTVEDVDKFVKANWVRVYEQYLERMWC